MPSKLLTVCLVGWCKGEIHLYCHHSTRFNVTYFRESFQQKTLGAKKSLNRKSLCVHFTFFERIRIKNCFFKSDSVFLAEDPILDVTINLIPD